MIENVADPFWGGIRGQNVAGKILMSLRASFSGHDSNIPLILVFGHSLVKYITPDMLDIPGKRVEIIAMRGGKIGEIFDIARWCVAPYVEKVLIYAGTNDLATRADHARNSDLIRKVKKYEQRLRQEAPDVKLSICQILNRPRNAGTRIERNLTAYNAALMKAKLDGKFSPLTNIVEIDPFPADMFTENDRLHLSRRGTNALARVLHSALR